MKIHTLLKKIVNQIETAFPQAGFTDKLIPYFEGREQDALVRPTEDLAFWDAADVTTAHIRAKLTFNDIVGQFEFRLLSRMEAKTTLNNNGWLGYELPLLHEAMKNLLIFLQKYIVIPQRRARPEEWDDGEDEPPRKRIKLEDSVGTVNNMTEAEAMDTSE